LIRRKPLFTHQAIAPSGEQREEVVKLEGRIAIVTGAGSGMGRAIAQEFVSEGANVLALDVRKAAVDETVDMVGLPDRIVAFECDVSNEESIKAAVAAAMARWGRVDIVCNNAGILDDYVIAEETSTELWNRILGVNLSGPFFMCREVLPIMVAQGKGVIVNTASISAFIAGGGGSAYTVSKHGVLGLTRQLAFEYGRKGVRVNAICPGPIHTGMTDYLLTPEGRNEHVDSIIEALPAGRWGKPVEIARLAVYLASDDADFVHGSSYVMDGGWLLP
jgi:NAD(P)-dependent dehydrogenase (short-subunit alcohol dehydrogenase family)